MPESLVLVDVEVTPLAAVYDRIYVAWFDFGPRRLPARPVHALLSNADPDERGGPPCPRATTSRAVPSGVGQLAAALSAAPLASFEPDAAVAGLSRLFGAAGRDPAPWPGVVDLRHLLRDRLGQHHPVTLTAACTALGVRPPHPLGGGGGRLGSALACLAAVDRFAVPVNGLVVTA